MGNDGDSMTLFIFFYDLIVHFFSPKTKFKLGFSILNWYMNWTASLWQRIFFAPSSFDRPARTPLLYSIKSGSIMSLHPISSRRISAVRFALFNGLAKMISGGKCKDTNFAIFFAWSNPFSVKGKSALPSCTFNKSASDSPCLINKISTSSSLSIILLFSLWNPTLKVKNISSMLFFINLSKFKYFYSRLFLAFSIKKTIL